MATIFERIVTGEIPAHVVWEDDEHLAFLDVNPRVEGHTLVIPKRAVPELYAMDEQPYLRLWAAARTVARRLRERTGCERVVTWVVGYEVPHVHVHLLPTSSMADVPLPPVDQEAKARLDETARRLGVGGLDR